MAVLCFRIARGELELERVNSALYTVSFKLYMVKVF